MNVEGSATDEAGRVVVAVGSEAEKEVLEARLRRVMVAAKRARIRVEMRAILVLGMMLATEPGSRDCQSEWIRRRRVSAVLKRS